MQEYEARGDPDASCTPTKRDLRAQVQAESIRDAVARSHFHQYTAGESAGSFFSHSHDEDEPGHVHPPRQACPARGDGGYLEESGPTLGTELPPAVAANAARALETISRWPATPKHQLMRWRLRLFCGHLVERTAHIDHRTVHAAFMGGMRCAECGLDPATIVAARALGPAAPCPPPLSNPVPAERWRLEQRLAKARAEVERLEAELARAPAEDA